MNHRKLIKDFIDTVDGYSIGVFLDEYQDIKNDIIDSCYLIYFEQLHECIGNLDNYLLGDQSTYSKDDILTQVDQLPPPYPEKHHIVKSFMRWFTFAVSQESSTKDKDFSKYKKKFTIKYLKRELDIDFIYSFIEVIRELHLCYLSDLYGIRLMSPDLEETKKLAIEIFKDKWWRMWLK